MLIDLVQLRTFVAVAEEQHLTRAAERLHISLSSASAHVRAVEESLDTKLFVRTNRSLELTVAGQVLLGKAKVLLNEATLFSSYAREIRGKLAGLLIVGSDNEPATSRIGEVAGLMRAKHPLIRLDLRARTSSSSRQGLKLGELDMGLLLEPSADSTLTYYRLTDAQFQVAGPAAWKSRIESASLADLASLPWIAPIDSSTSYSSMLRQLFDEHSLELDVVARFDNPALGRAMSAAGVGLMLMRQEHVRAGLADATLAVSPVAQARFPIHLVHLASRQDDPLIRAFLDATKLVWPVLTAEASGDAA